MLGFDMENDEAGIVLYPFVMQSFGLLLALGASAVWGLAYTVDQRTLVNVSPAMLLFLNGLVTLIMTAPIFLTSKTLRDLSSLDQTSAHLLLLSIVATICANFLILWSIKVLGASTAAILEISYPMFVFLFSYILLGTELNLYFWIGSLMIFAGSFTIIRFSGLQ